MPSYTLTITAVLGALLSVQAHPAVLSARDVIQALPGNATAIETKFQPLVDFDSDGCYNTAAISPDGKTNPGLGKTRSPKGGCRDPAQLASSNVYSRKRCNEGYCAIMYEYYFEKDQGPKGHRHEWEHM